jgi:hypothetical protein
MPSDKPWGWLLVFVMLWPGWAAAMAGEDSQASAAWLLNRADAALYDLGTGVFQQTEIGGGASTTEPGSGGGLRGKAVPMVLSMIMPGAGELYLGHYYRGGVLMAVDIASWMGVKHYHDKGNDIKTEYRAYADLHWSEDKFWGAYGQDPAADYYPGIDYFDTQNPSLYVSRVADEREWYENLGKWNQFVFGWDDFRDPRVDYGVGFEPGDAQLLKARWLGDPSVSPHREAYRRMREDSNNQFTNRDRLLYLNIATRVLSVFHVAYLQGMLGGGPKSELKVAGHSVRIIAEPRGLAATRLGVSVSY